MSCQHHIISVMLVHYVSYLANVFIQSHLQLIRLSRGQVKAVLWLLLGLSPLGSSY